MHHHEGEVPDILWIYRPAGQEWPDEWDGLVTDGMIRQWVNNIEPLIINKDFSRDYT